MYKEYNLEVVSEDFDYAEYVPNPTWTLNSAKQYTINGATRFKLYNYDRPVDLVGEDFVLEISLVRLPLYIMINGIFPCFILNLSIL